MAHFTWPWAQTVRSGVTNLFAIAGHFVSYRWEIGPHNFLVILWNLLVQNCWSLLNASQATRNSFAGRMRPASRMFITPALDDSISLKFLLETRLQFESFDTLDDLLGFQVQKLWSKAGVAKLRLASRMWHFEPLHAALWAFQKIMYLFFIFYFYCKL